MGRAAAGVWRGYRELPVLTQTWQSAPVQVLARLHALVARDVEPDEDLGRPRTGEPQDPLRIGVTATPAEVAARLSLLGRLVGQGTSAPALVEAAIVHGEVLTLQPFSTGSGVIARLCTRVVMAARGLDPDFLTIPEVGIQDLGRPAYVAAARRYAEGTPDGVAEWIRFMCTAVSYGSAAADHTLAGIRDQGVATGAEEE